MAELHTPFGLPVRRVREQRGIALEEFGDRVGLDWRILAGIERGEYTIYLETIEQVARASFGVEPWELIRMAEEARG